MIENSSIELPTTAGQLGKFLGAELIGNADAPIRTLAPLGFLEEGSLSFISSVQYQGQLRSKNAGVILSTPDLSESTLPVTFLVVKEPKKAFLSLAQLLQKRPQLLGIDESAKIHPSVVLGNNVGIGAFCVLNEGVVIKDGTQVGPFSYIGENTQVGAGCYLAPRVTLRENTRIGNRVSISSGTVIGSEGFGLELDAETGKLLEVAQIGIVEIQDDVRIGANVTIDRATVGKTFIGQGTKIDDQVHIAHNCQIGKNCILCGCVGLSGSVVLEDQVILAGQVGVSDHVRIGHGARVGAGSGVGTHIPAGETHWLYPSVPMREAIRMVKYMRKLPEMWKKIKKLEGA